MKFYSSEVVLFMLILRWMVFFYNLFFFPRLKPKPSVNPNKRVSILIPARNEAENLRKNLPSVLAQGAEEVIVLDDLSEDETAEVALSIGSLHPGFRLIRGTPPPPGWKGKNWACWQLANAAKGEVLVFTDADVFWYEGALAAIVEELKGTHLVTLFTRQELGLRDGVVVGFLMNGLFSLLPYPLIVRLGFANGQVMAFDRNGYFSIGGHAAVRGEVLEDVALGRKVKSYKLFLGVDIAKTRMYRGYREAVMGFAKNILPIHGNSVPILLSAAFYHVQIYTLPWVLGDWEIGILGILERLLVHMVHKSALWVALLTPLAPLIFLPVYFLGLLPGKKWKGRPV